MWIARDCVPLSTPSFFWDWNAEWQILRQSSGIQDGHWACQAQLYLPHLTLTEPKKENMKGKTGMMKLCPMRTCVIYHCVIFIHFEIIWSKNRKRWWINLQMLAKLSASIIYIFVYLKKLHDYKSHLNMTQLVLNKVFPLFNGHVVFCFPPEWCPVSRKTECMKVRFWHCSTLFLSSGSRSFGVMLSASKRPAVATVH